MWCVPRRSPFTCLAVTHVATQYIYHPDISISPYLIVLLPVTQYLIVILSESTQWSGQLAVELAARVPTSSR